MKILFIGNSATYVHEVPKMLERLARGAGCEIETDMVVKGGFRLSQHAAGSPAREKIALEEMQRGYDLVILQEVGNCFATEETRTETSAAVEVLHKAIQKSGAKTVFYVRPPYGRDLEGFDALSQCKELDKLFVGLSQKLGTDCVFVNRAFAAAMPIYGRELWGEDNAHTSPLGAYLSACTFFASLFDRSATCLETEGLPDADAKALQELADRVAKNGLIPWKE